MRGATGVKVLLVGVWAAASPALAGAGLPPRPISPATVVTGNGNGPYTPPPCVAGVPFADVTCSTFYDGWIEQFARDGITAGCGGGNYCPNENVTRAQMAVFIEAAMRGTGNWPAHTQLVWAVKAADGSPDPIASGTALLNAVAAIPTTGNDAPSFANPWLVKAGPGVYNLNGGVVYLPAYVNLEGAGMHSTTITTANDTSSTLSAGGENAISDVAITNTGNGANTYAIYFEGAGDVYHLDRVHIEAHFGTSNNIGIFTYNAFVFLRDSEIFSSGYGVYTTGTQTYDRIDIARTQVSANAVVFNSEGCEIDLADTQVEGTLDNFSPGVFKCFGDYDGNWAAVTCP